MSSELGAFHPAVAAWFSGRFGEPTEPQRRAWPAIRERRHTLIAAPTGSGKTLAAFLSAIDDLVRQAERAPLPDGIQVVYVSPLKALSNDIRRNLEEPLAGIDRELEAHGGAPSGIRSLVRTGDTPPAERASMVKRPPHILVTTPESLYILLTSESGRGMLEHARTVIVDEIHAVADDKRGSHLSLSLERLDALCRPVAGPLLRIGLSATQRPIEEVARFLVGAREEPYEIVDTGHRRALDLALELPGSPLEAVMPGEVWTEIYDRLAALIREHRTTLIFVNTRRQAERIAHHLSERIGEGRVASHHGSLAREQRFDAEQRLKAGNLSALVATASLELGIDIGSVDLVCTIGSTRSIATLLQRIGRSGHQLRGTPKGRIFPTSRDELVECAALLDAVRRDELERLVIPDAPADVLAQQIAALVACEEWSEDELYALVRRAHPYRNLARDAFDATVEMLAEGFSTRRGRRSALIHHDRVHGRLRARRGTRLAAITSGGTIPEKAEYRVVLEPQGTFVGTVDEDFAIESIAGDVFQLGNTAWRIRRIDSGRVLVEDAHGEPPNIPFWLGEAPGRSPELSLAVARLREDVASRAAKSRDEAIDWLADEVGTGRVAAEQVVEYLSVAAAALGAMPTQDTLVLERFFDEAGNQHLVIHSPFGNRMNRAFGLALRKRFCRQFNFELQAAATDDGIVLSLGPTHSFPAADAFSFLRSATVRHVLVQALLDAPMFAVRWRWNATNALALPRFSGGRRVPPRIQRMRAEDLIAVVFPDQLACLENIVGERDVPDHPLVGQTIRDCLEEAMDIGRLEALLARIEAGEVTLVARDLREPSPLAHEVINARPYAFLDDAPLEERRTMAVYTRRWLDPETAADLGKLDAEAIARVRAEVFPDVRDADELHDALVTFGFLVPGECPEPWQPLMKGLVADYRATIVVSAGGASPIWVGAERVPQVQTARPDGELRPPLALPARVADETWSADEARVVLLRGRLSLTGPVTADDLAATSGIERGAIDIALATLETQGFAMQGRFTPGATGTEWCERGLLARIHRYTLTRLRREIEPVAKADFMRFLAAWQRVDPAERASGAESVTALLEQLEGYCAPAGAWESEILPARVENYDPAWLDALCLSGRYTWARARVPDLDGAGGSKPISTTPITLVSRGRLGAWQRSEVTSSLESLSSGARSVHALLTSRGACFFDEIVRGTGLLRTQVEDALGELVGTGEVTSDSFTGLRALLTPSDRRPPIDRRRKRSTAVFGMDSAGRWSLLKNVEPSADADVEYVARTLLRRYGVVFRRLLVRESLAPPWRDLLPVYRRLEARGEIRGGRFVDGFSGEQFALADAVGRLRAQRRATPSGESFSISAADPLNLSDSVLPGPRVPALTRNRLLLCDGSPLATYVSGDVAYAPSLTDPARQWEARNALLRRRVPPTLRAYMGSGLHFIH